MTSTSWQTSSVSTLTARLSTESSASRLAGMSSSVKSPSRSNMNGMARFQ